MTGALSTAERSCPTSKVRDRSWEDPHARRATAKRSYPTSEVRGSGLDSQAATAQELPRGATLRPRTGATAGKNDLHPRPGAEAGRSNPTSKEWWLCGRRRA